MSKHMKYLISLYLIIIFSSATCLSDERAIYCHSELTRESLDCRNDIFSREFVVPEGGSYRCYFWPEKTEGLPQLELQALNSIKTKLDLNPVHIEPLFVQISKQKDNAGMHHIQAICIVLQEFINPPLIDPIFAEYSPGRVNSVDFNTLVNFSQLVHLELYAFNVEKLVFSDVSKLAGLEYLGLPYKTRDQHLKHIGSLNKLKFINASGTKIKGTGFQYLATLPKLRILDLRHTQLELGTLVGLRKCKSLETLLLSDTNIKDDDLKALIDLKTLKYITLHKTTVTDEALKILSQLKNLKYVTLYDTSTTKSGHDGLKKRHPSINIDLLRPKHIKEFLTDSLYIAAYRGDIHAQLELASRYNQARRNFWIYGSERKKLESMYAKQPWGLALYDPVESLMWNIILLARKDMKLQIRVDEDTINREIKNLELQMDSFQIAEARRRARAYLYLLPRSSFKFEIERKEGLPLYQYQFPMID